jgi:EPS-associated MarR family transcriptional regulator
LNAVSTGCAGDQKSPRAVAWQDGLMNSRETRQEDTHFRVLRLLQENPNLTQRELADLVGISLGAANYCLKALLDKGLIKVRNFRNSEQKMAYVYLLTPSGIARKADLTARFLGRKLGEYEQLKVEIEMLKREVRTQYDGGTAPGNDSKS